MANPHAQESIDRPAGRDAAVLILAGTVVASASMASRSLGSAGIQSLLLAGLIAFLTGSSDKPDLQSSAAIIAGRAFAIERTSSISLARTSISDNGTARDALIRWLPPWRVSCHTVSVIVLGTASSPNSSRSA